MTYKKAFPDFDYIPFLSMHADWVDSSYKNDTMPSFERFTQLRTGILKCWFNYNNPDLREVYHDSKFSICLYSLSEDYLKQVYFSDNENDFRKTLKRMELI